MMALYICKHKERYNLYTTIADGFWFKKSISLEQLKKFYREKYGSDGMNGLEERLARASETGTSAYDETLESTLGINRAGKNEKHLSLNECIEKFLT